MWNYEGDYLEKWEPSRRSYITNLYCWAYRGETVRRVQREEDALSAPNLRVMLERLEQHKDERLSHDWTDDSIKADLVKLNVWSDESKAFARFIAKREQLHPEVKEEFKKERQETYAKKAMSSKPPSEKQIQWLKKYGKEIPATMAEASALLDQCFKKR